MRVAFVFMVCLTPLLIAQTENNCMECASVGLKGRWALTGFSQTLKDEAFVVACDAATNKELATSCSGPCLTYIFDDPDLIASGGSATGTNFLVVRGCQRRLTNVQTPSTSNNFGANGFCEYDKDFSRLNSRGDVVRVRSAVRICSGNLCNTALTDFSKVTSQCTGQTTDLLNNAEINCYDCDSENGNCFSSKDNCNKKYCFKGSLDIHGVKSVHKTCADFNPFGGNAACGRTAVTVSPGNLVKLSGTLTQCFCKDRQYCNYAHHTIAASSLMLLSALVTALFH